MSKKVFYLSLLLSTISHSQVQKIFYVNDVKTIEYVTVNFCVNDSAQINKVSVIQSKTTYENNEVIQQLKDYLKSIQYYPDSKLRNKCYDSTFEFVNAKFHNSQLNESYHSKCKEFKNGKFRYLDVRYLDTKIVRRNKIQREKSNDFKAKWEVTWTSPCDYEMKYLKIRGKEKSILNRRNY